MLAISWVPLDQQRIIIGKVGTATKVPDVLRSVSDEIRTLPTEFIHQTFGFDWIESNVERMHLSGAELEGRD